MCLGPALVLGAQHAAGLVAEGDERGQAAAHQGAIGLQGRRAVGHWHGLSLLDLHEGLALCDKETALREVGLQGRQRGWGTIRVCWRGGVRRGHACGQLLDGGGELGGEVPLGA